MPRSLIRKRKRDSHKGDYGHVLVIAGSLGMTGAAYLASEAALLSGAGLVTLGIPKSLNSIMERKLTEVMTLPLPETSNAALSMKAFSVIMAFAKKCDSVALGPGLSQNKQTQRLIRSLIEKLDIPMVIDADGLNALSCHLNILQATSHKPQAKVITPHPGEMSRLLGNDISFIKKNKKTVASRFADKYNVTTVLKGCMTVVASPGFKKYVNLSGNPGMASGGSGDVLTGIISAFLAQGMDGFKAARLGVYVHGLSGDIAAEEKGEISLRATDLLKFLPMAFKKIYG
ncbi:MAG: NAD(P)H-hydrate dehydratase [Candidatus Omnitrophota bacterium]